MGAWSGRNFNAKENDVENFQMSASFGLGIFLGGFIALGWQLSTIIELLKEIRDKLT